MAIPGVISITYVPADCGSVIPGKCKAPQAFRDVHIVEKLSKAGFATINESHALATPATYIVADFKSGGVRNEDLNIAVCKDVYRSITKELDAVEAPPFQLVLGGECCMLPAILSAFWKQSNDKRIGLLYIDADTDLTSPTDTTSTGFFAGMNMTHLIRSAGALPSMEQFSRSTGEPVCDASNTVLFGTNMSLPGNKSEHFAYLFDHDFKVVSSASVASDPIRRAAEALKYLEERVDIIVVHLDVDSIDPQLFPLANVPNFTGVTFEQMMKALKVFLSSQKVAGLVVAEVNPDHDPGLKMIERLTTEIVGALASKIS